MQLRKKRVLYCLIFVGAFVIYGNISFKFEADRRQTLPFPISTTASVTFHISKNNTSTKIQSEVKSAVHGSTKSTIFAYSEENTTIDYLKQITDGYSEIEDMVEIVKNIKQMKEVSYVKINKFKNKFLLSPSTKCGVVLDTTFNTNTTNNNKNIDYPNLFLLVIIKSAFYNLEQRNAIRETWGKEIYWKNVRGIEIRTVFVVGLPPIVAAGNINEEALEHGDIIQVDFKDTYFNNTLKTTASINWATRYCSNAEFVVLVDDDYFVNPENLVDMLKNLPSASKTKLYMGTLYEGYKPHRNYDSKWYVSISEYPYDIYPPFVSAGTVILSKDVVTDFQIAMQYIKPFRLDDIYLAIVARKLHIKPKQNVKIHNFRITPSAKSFTTAIAAHGYKPVALRRCWNWHTSQLRKNSF